MLPKVERGFPHHNTVDDIKRRYFTDAAYEAIRHIPTVVGPTGHAYAAGSTFLSNVASFLTFNGVGRKVVVTRSKIEGWGIDIFLHEFTHHLDDMDRDGDGEFVDHDEFREAYERLLLDEDYKWLRSYVKRALEPYSDFYNAFLGIGDLSEEMAYVASGMASSGVGPEYMWHAMRGILRHPSAR